MEHAGHTGFPDEGPVGVFAGSGASYYLMDHVRRNPALMRSMGEFLVRHTNNDMNFLATRVSYEMDLRGPSLNIQTACSTALVAVHVACESIRRGECRLAIAGGSTVLIPDRRGYLYHEGEIMSPDGHCRPFDAKSAGTVFGSGSGCVVLKRLSAALDDGDTVHAVIKGSAVNNDGAMRVGYLAPGVEGQAAAVALALDASGVPADSISYIETHGTGTSVGDPIEVAALNQAFRGRTDRRRYCAIGSVKSNMGHLGEAAGAASLIKAVMALKHRQLPPSLGFETPSPQIDFDDSPFFVNDKLRPWSAEGPRRCGVTSLGAGGTNCHLILEEAPAHLDAEGARAAHLLVLSARTPDALTRSREALATRLEEDSSVALADAAWTLAAGRRPMAERCALVVRDRDSAVRLLRDPGSKLVLTQRADDATRSVVFMFPGGGAQYPRMGLDLYQSEPAYRDAADACFAVINPVLGRRLETLLFCEPADLEAAGRELERPALTLPALFTTEYALAKMYEAWGIRPVALLGHSMGEYVAACLAGVMTLEEALRLVMLRGRLFEATARGGMLSVPLPEAELRSLMPPGLSIAAVNAPELCVASGPVALIDELERLLEGRDIDSTRVRIEVAAHSSMLDPILDEFRALCRTIAWRPPQIPFVSNVSGQWIRDDEATNPDYWVNHLRSTVRFADCLDTITAGDERVLLEIGPGRTLSTLARSQARPARFVSNSMRHADEVTSDLDFALTVVGRLWLAGVPIEWSALYDGQLLNRIPLPTYSWDHARYWIEPPAPGATPEPAASDGGRRQRVEDWFTRPFWRQALPLPAVTAASKRVVVFADAAGFCDLVAGVLRAAGREVTLVRSGPAWVEGQGDFTVRPAATEDYERLVKALMAGGGLPDHIIHGWGVTEGQAPTLESVLDHGFHSLHCLAQALSNEDPDARLVLDVLTSNLQRVAGESVLEPAKALVLGPARVMPQEFPNVRARAIDLVLPPVGAARHGLAALVAAETAADPKAETVAFRGRDRFEMALESVQLDGGVTARLREGGVYLITGGLGGIGYTLAEHLARRYRAKLVLLGRGAAAGRAQSRIAALEASGAEVLVVQADVTLVDQMSSAVSRAVARFGRIDGVFHAAGVLGDSLMPLKTREDAERVLAPKVQGTLALDVALAGIPVDFLVLFSSISSLAGLPGQSDYTGANAFLDAFAQARNAQDGTFVVALNWSAWRETGMAANIASGAGAAGGGDIHEEIHPVLGHRIWANAEAELFAAQLSVPTHWVLAEHRIRGGRSLMPGTGHLELVRAAIQARPEPRTLEIRDLAFMSAFVVPEQAPRELRVHVARNGGAHHAVAIAGRATADDGRTVWQEHVTAHAGYVDTPPPSPLDLKAIAGRCTVREERFTPTQESPHMDFGGRWKNLVSIRYGKGEALVTLELPSAYADELEQYPLHPALLDMATGRCEGLVPGVDPTKDFYVPLSYTTLRMFAPLASRIAAHVRLAPSDFDPKELVVFNVTITDESGRVLVDVEEFVMTRVTDTSQLQDPAARPDSRRAHASFEPPAAPAVAPPMVQMLDGAIGSAEGMEAIERVLAGPPVPQLFATPLPVEKLIADLRQPPVRPAPAAAAGPVVPTVPVEEVEAALVTHEAIRECAVLQRRNRPGELKLVAYMAFEPGEQATVSDLRRFLKARLTENLVPSTFVDLDTLPKAADGSIDRGALPDPFGAVDDSVAPRTETEALIADIWKEVLGVDRISVYDNFFDAGGHSLLAVRVVVKIDKKIGVRLNQAVMVLQTLEQIAAECDRRRATTAAAAAPAPAADPAPAASGLGRRLMNALRRE